MDPASVEQLQTQLDKNKAHAEPWKDKEETAKKHEEIHFTSWKQKTEALASKMILDVGGTLFSTTRDTVLRVKHSYFTCMLESGNWKPQKDGTYFLDRDATCFGRILNYMRYGTLDTVGLSVEQTKMLQTDFDYFFPNQQWNGHFSLCSGHMNTLKGWLGDHFDASKLLWRGSRDGFTAETFHKRCDNQGSTLTVIKSANDWIFGGYNPSNWSSGNTHSNCPNAFLFTLTNPNGIPPTQYFCHNPTTATYNYNLWSYFWRWKRLGRHLKRYRAVL